MKLAPELVEFFNTNEDKLIRLWGLKTLLGNHRGERRFRLKETIFTSIQFYFWHKNKKMYQTKLYKALL